MSEPRVALTFDAEHPSHSQCPPGNPDRILDALAEASVKATFFLQGRWATAYPDTARAIARAGYLIGNHSNYHARLPLFSQDGLAQDLQEAEESIRRVTAVDPRPWFRCPFGAGAEDPLILGVLASAGYRNVPWDVDGADWKDGQSAARVQAAIVSGVRARGDGAIVLLHTWPEPALGALPGIVAELRARGLSFVTVEELWDVTAPRTAQ